MRAQERRKVDEMNEEMPPAMTGKRVRLQVTVHPLTDGRMDELCRRFATSKGRLIDKLVEVLHSSYGARKQYCITGRPCKIELTDLPDVF